MCIFTNAVVSWVLIWFKREFPFDDVLRLWEVKYPSDFVWWGIHFIFEGSLDGLLQRSIRVVCCLGCTRIA